MRRVQSTGSVAAESSIRRRTLAQTPSFSHVGPDVSIASSNRSCKSAASNGRAAGKLKPRRTADVADPLVHQFCEVLAVLIQEPLTKLVATLSSDEESVQTAGLGPVVDFLTRLADTVQDLRKASTSEDVPGCLQRLQNSRDDLGLWADCASKALRGLLVNAGLHRMGLRLHSLQENLSAAVDGMWTRRSVEERSSKEISELRSELRQSHAEASRMAEAFGELSRKCVEEQSLERQTVNQLVQGIARERARDAEELAEHMQHVQRMSSMWSSHASFRDQELQDLRRRADAAATALESTEKAARSREDNLRISKEELLQDLAKVRLSSEELAHELAQEKVQRNALAVQVGEARDSLAGRDAAIVELRRSLAEGHRIPTGEPMYMRHLIQPVATEDSELYWGVPHATAVAPPPCDDAASVRMSTDSTSMHQVLSRGYPMDEIPSLARTARRNSPAMPPVPPLPGRGGGGCHLAPQPPRGIARGVPATSSALRRSVTSVVQESMDSEAAVGAVAAAGGAVAASPARPWEMPPKDFLDLWRRSRSNSPARTYADPPKETLCITASLE
mmetsp:Transcript_44951/g.103961  ORF Transcript_44951/g.103961 Transcript_44951/m.103961 type:complete len:563 (-) Transcript_44951:61-1749(-)